MDCRYKKYSEELKQEILEYAKHNRLKDVVTKFNINESTIRRWTNPQKAAEYKEKRKVDISKRCEIDPEYLIKV